MSDREAESTALETCLQSLKHLSVDFKTLRFEPDYAERRGGFGDVRVATLNPDTETSKLVAAKTIRLRDRYLDPQRLAFRLARELKVWAALQHPHILPLTGFYLDEGFRVAVLLSDYMPRGDLREFIRQEKPSLDMRLRLIRDFTHGLAYLHGRDPPVRHGDLKMGNILINAQRRAMLADFGLSRALETESTGLTTSDGFKGTIRYSSPEMVLQPEASHSLYSDIWAWGCLVLEVLTDRIAYEDKRSEHAIILALINNELPGHVETIPIPTPTVKNLIGHCWTIRPQDRPSAEQCLRTVLAVPLSPGLDIPIEITNEEQCLVKTVSGASNERVAARPQKSDQLATAEVKDGDHVHSDHDHLSRPLGSLSPSPSAKATVDLFDHRTKCNGCHINIVGERYQCANCPSIPDSYSLCSRCENESFVIHPFPHVFLKLSRRVDHPIRNRSPLLPVIYELDLNGQVKEHCRSDAFNIALCDFCMTPIQGTWYRCVYCYQDLCGYHESIHDMNHVCLAIKARTSSRILGDLWDLNTASNNAPLIDPVFDVDSE